VQAALKAWATGLVLIEQIGKAPTAAMAAGDRQLQRTSWRMAELGCCGDRPGIVRRSP